MLKEGCFFQDHFFPRHRQSWCLFEVCGRVEFVSQQFLSLISAFFHLFCFLSSPLTPFTKLILSSGSPRRLQEGSRWDWEGTGKARERGKG